MKITIREVIPYTFQSFIFFALSLFLGCIYAHYQPEQASQIFDAAARDAASITTQVTAYQALDIFLNNSGISLMMIFQGIIIGFILKFRYGSYIALLFNGFMIGVISYISVASDGILVLLLLTMIHGIIELPTVFFSAGLGVMAGTRAKDRKFDRAALYSTIKLFILVVVPFYAISAIIEAFITGGIVVPFLRQMA